MARTYSNIVIGEARGCFIPIKKASKNNDDNYKNWVCKCTHTLETCERRTPECDSKIRSTKELTHGANKCRDGLKKLPKKKPAYVTQTDVETGRVYEAIFSIELAKFYTDNSRKSISSIPMNNVIEFYKNHIEDLLEVHAVRNDLRELYNTLKNSASKAVNWEDTVTTYLSKLATGKPLAEDLQKVMIKEFVKFTKEDMGNYNYGNISDYLSHPHNSYLSYEDDEDFVWFWYKRIRHKYSSLLTKNLFSYINAEIDNAIKTNNYTTRKIDAKEVCRKITISYTPDTAIIKITKY